MEFPQVLQELMDNSNLKPYGLSKLMGCSQSSVRNWLMGERKPYASTMSRLADIFGVTPAQLEGEETIDFGSLMKAPTKPHTLEHYFVKVLQNVFVVCVQLPQKDAPD